jgi:Fe2+ or Zn2+ uptake regulation protein
LGRALSTPIDGAGVHDAIALRLAALDQRYTRGRRAIVDVLVNAGRPLTVPEILASASGLPQSSTYRNLTLLIEVGIVHRLPGGDEFARYELAEEFAGHHHHLTCASCGTIADVSTSPRLERALAEAARIAAAETGFRVTGHHTELVGLCDSCV